MRDLIGLPTDVAPVQADPRYLRRKVSPHAGVCGNGLPPQIKLGVRKPHTPAHESTYHMMVILREIVGFMVQQCYCTSIDSTPLPIRLPSVRICLAGRRYCTLTDCCVPLQAARVRFPDDFPLRVVVRAVTAPALVKPPRVSGNNYCGVRK